MRIILVLIFCLMTSLAYAEVTGEIIAKDIDEKGNIRIWTQYKIDGVEVESRYPKIDGKYVYATRFAAHNFAGLSDAQIELRILRETKAQSKNLFKQEFIRKTISTNNEIFDKHLKTIVGKSISVETAEIKVGDDITLEIKTDGTSSIKSILIP